MSKKKKSGKKKKSKKRSEKASLKAKIKDLSAELAEIDKDLQQQEQILVSLKELRNRELESKESCVAYLQRTLKSKTDQCMSVQNELQFAKDMKELVDIKAADARRNLEKNREISNTLFSQQRSELTGQLSALEEKRLQRSNQLSYLKRLENDLEEKVVTNEREEREEEKLRVSNLLEKKRTFQNMVDNLCAESMEVFQLTLPVYAKRQLYDNVCLRRLCDEVSENILDEQDRSRHLTKIEKTLNVEKETQIYTEDLLKSQLHKLNSDLEYLVESETKLRFVDASEDEADIKDKYLDIRNMIGELCRAEDERTDLLKISKDQEEYKVVLEKQLEEKIDLNGRMMSAILRAGKIVHSRLKEVGGKSDYDLEFLRQISMLLEDFLD